jgi:hypothetical protein
MALQNGVTERRALRTAAGGRARPQHRAKFVAGRQGFEPRYRGPESGAGIPVGSGPLWFVRVRSITGSVRFGPLRCAPVQNVSSLRRCRGRRAVIAGRAYLAVRAAFSGCDAHVVVQELRSEVHTVGPRESVKLGMNLKPPEDCRVAERFEYRSVELLLEVDLSRGVVAESQPDHIPADIPRFDDVVVHGYSSGGMRSSGCRRRARSQSSNNSCLCSSAHSSSR